MRAAYVGHRDRVVAAQRARLATVDEPSQPYADVAVARLEDVLRDQLWPAAGKQQAEGDDADEAQQ